MQQHVLHDRVGAFAVLRDLVEIALQRIDCPRPRDDSIKARRRSASRRKSNIGKEFFDP
jgi:hypothetical protein